MLFVVPVQVNYIIIRSPNQCSIVRSFDRSIIHDFLPSSPERTLFRYIRNTAEPHVPSLRFYTARHLLDIHNMNKPCYLGCECESHRDVYRDWPWRDAELSISHCMRTCPYCGEKKPTASNLRRHLRKMQYQERNLVVKHEKQGSGSAK